MITFAHVVEVILLFSAMLLYLAHVSGKPKTQPIPPDWKHEVDVEG